MTYNVVTNINRPRRLQVLVCILIHFSSSDTAFKLLLDFQTRSTKSNERSANGITLFTCTGITRLPLQVFFIFKLRYLVQVCCC
jgi:hypothetical protein